MSDMNSNELEEQLRDLAQAHKPDAVFAQQLEQRLMTAHGVAKPLLLSRVLISLGLADAPSTENAPQEAAGVWKRGPNGSLASAAVLGVLVLAGGLVFALNGFRPAPSSNSSISSIAPAPTTKPTKKPTVKPTFVPTPLAKALTKGVPSTPYEVKPGDTCLAIAQQFNVSVADLISLNKLDMQCNIQVGQKLAIPNAELAQIVPLGPVPTTTPPEQKKPLSIKLNEFRLSTTEAAAGERITATWSFEGAANKVTILVPQPGETGEYLYTSSPITRQAGSMAFTVPGFWTQTQDVQLSINDTVIATIQLNKALAKCKDPWFFTPRPEGCPDGPIIKTFAAVQLFEGGRMFWFQVNRSIVVLYNAEDGTSTRVQAFVDNFAEGTPEADPNLIAPEGKQQPKRGFGWLWRTYPDVRQRLGWALQPEQGFNTCIASSNPRYTHPTSYFSDNAGSLIQVMRSSTTAYEGWYPLTLQDGVRVKVQCSP